jgi:hypothetical protein
VEKNIEYMTNELLQRLHHHTALKDAAMFQGFQRGFREIVGRLWLSINLRIAIWRLSRRNRGLFLKKVARRLMALPCCQILVLARPYIGLVRRYM